MPASTASGNSIFSDVYEYDGPPPTIWPAREDANRHLVVKAWYAVYIARDFTVLDRYWALGDGYLQHNPNVPNGVGGLRGFLGSLPPSVTQNRFAVAFGHRVSSSRRVSRSARSESPHPPTGAGCGTVATLAMPGR